MPKLKPEPQTYVDPEEKAYPHGGFTRRGKAIWPDGVVRAIRVSIPDTFFSIPARGTLNGKTITGWVGCEDGVWEFHPDKEDAE